MKHEEAVLLLPDLSMKGLDERVRSDLLAHREGCAECQDVSGLYDLFVSAVQENAAGASLAHPSSEEIVAYALQAETLLSEWRRQLASHLLVCPSCSEEVTLARDAERASRPRVLHFPFGRVLELSPAWHPGLAAGMAAGLVLAVLAYPAYLGLNRVPELTREAGELQKARVSAEAKARTLTSRLAEAQERLGRVQNWVGPVQWLFLTGPRRGERPIPQLRLASGQPFVLVAVQASVPAGAAGLSVFRAEIRNVDGRVAWRSELTAAQMRESLDLASVIALPVPASALAPGPYKLTIASAEASSGEPLFVGSFETSP